ALTDAHNDWLQATMSGNRLDQLTTGIKYVTLQAARDVEAAVFENIKNEALKCFNLPDALPQPPPPPPPAPPPAAPSPQAVCNQLVDTQRAAKSAYFKTLYDYTVANPQTVLDGSARMPAGLDLNAPVWAQEAELSWPQPTAQLHDALEKWRQAENALLKSC